MLVVLIVNVSDLNGASYRPTANNSVFTYMTKSKKKRPRCLVEYTHILVRVYLVNVYFSLTQVALSFSYGVLIVFSFARPIFQGYGLPWHSKT